MITGEAWVTVNGNEKFSDRVAFIKAKECDGKKDDFDKVLKLDDEELIRTSDIGECYMRFNPGEHQGFGKGYWLACEQGKGAAQFFYASYDYID